MADRGEVESPLLFDEARTFPLIEPQSLYPDLVWGPSVSPPTTQEALPNRVPSISHQSTPSLHLDVGGSWNLHGEGAGPALFELFAELDRYTLGIPLVSDSGQMSVNMPSSSDTVLWQSARNAWLHAGSSSSDPNSGAANHTSVNTTSSSRQPESVLASGRSRIQHQLSQGEAESARTPYPTSQGFSASVGHDDDDEDDEATCAVCSETRRYLKKLPCGHRFCEYCLQQIVNQHTRGSSGGHFPCPFCRARITIPERGASEFPLSMAGPLQMEEVAAALMTVTTQQESGGRCGGCGEEESRFTCMRCQTQVCNYCRHDHHQHPLLLLPSHNSLMVHNQQAASHCSAHPLQQLHSFCSSCHLLTCELCQRENHAGHKVVTLSQATDSASQLLRKAQSNVERRVRLLQAAQDHLTKEKKSTLQDLNNTRRLIQDRAAEARAMIDQHENAALASLNKEQDKFKGKLEMELNLVQDKIEGLLAVVNHMERVLQSENQYDVVRMQLSACDTISKPGFLDKYTNNLPFHHYNMELRHGKCAGFTDVVKMWIGQPCIVKSQVTPAVATVMEKTSLDPAGDWRALTIEAVCPVDDRHVWITQGNNSSSPTTIGLCNLDTGQVSRTSKVDGQASLVKVDQGLALAKLPHSQRVLVLEGKHENVHSSRAYQSMLFTKGLLRACLWVTRTSQYPCPMRMRTQLMVNIHSLQDVFDVGKTVLTLPNIREPRSMDMSSDGQLLVIVDGRKLMHVFQRGSRKAKMVISVDDNSKLLHSISDVCFYKLGSREVLLIADPSQPDVLVMEVSRQGCFLLAFLTNMSGSLQHPSALNVDSTKGYLVVGCEGKSIALCGDTGVQMGGGRSYLACLKTRSA